LRFTRSLIKAAPRSIDSRVFAVVDVVAGTVDMVVVAGTVDVVVVGFFIWRVSI
jgi:hypothetical protein